MKGFFLMQNNIELLSPVGDFDCLRAAVQNGADCVYFGGSSFNARAQATNFDENSLVEAIRYAKLRNVKVNFTLNILLKDEELEDAKKLVEKLRKFVYNSEDPLHVVIEQSAEILEKCTHED